MADSAAARRSSATASETEAARLLIVGLGNPMMADDGVGHSVVRRLERVKLPPGVRLCTVDGDILTLTEMWRGEKAVWLVDSVSGGSPPGTLRVFEHQELFGLPTGRLTTHHPGLSECLRWLLHGRPEMSALTFRLFGIEAGLVGPVQGLSDEVEDAIRSVVDVIHEAAGDWVSHRCH
jgi:hydrogenase maturation protease